MHKHHLLIAGTGRAGTTFLVQLLTELGLETGFANSREGIHKSANAGMEWQVQDIVKKTAPYVVKSPSLVDYIHEVLQAPDIVIDFTVIPVRDLYAAAESRRANARAAGNPKAPGGLLNTKNPDQQEAILAEQFHRLVQALVEHDVPMIWLHFPRLVKDAEYLYAKLKPALPGKDFAEFSRAFKAVSRPELVHDFKPKSAAQKNLLQKLNPWTKD